MSVYLISIVFNNEVYLQAFIIYRYTSVDTESIVMIIKAVVSSYHKLQKPHCQSNSYVFTVIHH